MINNKKRKCELIFAKSEAVKCFFGKNKNMLHFFDNYQKVQHIVLILNSI